MNISPLQLLITGVAGTEKTFWQRTLMTQTNQSCGKMVHLMHPIIKHFLIKKYSHFEISGKFSVKVYGPRYNKPRMLTISDVVPRNVIIQYFAGT